LRKNFGLDQLQRAYSALRHNPDSRQVVLQLWDSRIDFPGQKGQARSLDIPCNVVSMLKVRNDRLEWLQVLRSNDVFLGLPQNIVQFTYLQEVMSGWLGLQLGSYNQISDSLHVYNNEHLQAVRESEASATGRNTDSIAVPKRESEAAFAELAGRTDRLISPDLTASDLLTLADWPSCQESFRNLLCVLCAQTARKLHQPDIGERIMSTCSNPALTLLWHNWTQSRRLRQHDVAEEVRGDGKCHRITG
jgi:thymidylate synthase